VIHVDFGTVAGRCWTCTERVPGDGLAIERVRSESAASGELNVKVAGRQGSFGALTAIAIW